MYDEESGFYYLRSRYYDPYIGRFLNADVYVSTGQGLVGHNMFVYCNNNQVMLKDSIGKYPVLAIIGLVVCLAGVALTVTSDTNRKEERFENEKLELKDAQKNVSIDIQHQHSNGKRME